MWDSRPPHPLLLGPATTAMSSLVSPVTRAKGQHWTSKSQGGPGRAPQAGPVSWADPEHTAPAPRRDEALKLFCRCLCPFYSNCGPLLPTSPTPPRHAGTSEEGKKEATGTGGSQVGMSAQVQPPRGPHQNCALSPLLILFDSWIFLLSPFTGLQPLLPCRTCSGEVPVALAHCPSRKGLPNCLHMAGSPRLMCSFPVGLL